MTNFPPNGFSREPLTGEEAARHRNALNRLDANWSVIEDAVTVSRAVGIISAMIKIGVPVALVAAGVGAYVASQGWIG